MRCNFNCKHPEADLYPLNVLDFYFAWERALCKPNPEIRLVFVLCSENPSSTHPNKLPNKSVLSSPGLLWRERLSTEIAMIGSHIFQPHVFLFRSTGCYFLSLLVKV